MIPEIIQWYLKNVTREIRNYAERYPHQYILTGTVPYKRMNDLYG
jgi:hypothetical protein